MGNSAGNNSFVETNALKNSEKSRFLISFKAAFLEGMQFPSFLMILAASNDLR